MKETTVLLVEDSEDDAFFFKRAVEKSNFSYRIHVARTGLEAQHYMSGAGEFADREKFPLPKFIITDGRMPEVDGKEFLLWMKHHPQFRVVPLILLSDSTNPSDIENAYEDLRVEAYIVKPATPEQLAYVVKLIFEFWAVCEIPLWKLNKI